MLDQVTGMRVFVRVAAAGSLAAAGRSLGLSQTMVTKHVDATEARLGVRLLHRSTRRLTLTEAGRGYLEACQRILAEIEEADEAAAAGQAEPRGLLRLNAPVSFGTSQVAPLLGGFAASYPKVRLDVGLNDRVVDLIGLSASGCLAIPAWCHAGWRRAGWWCARRRATCGRMGRRGPLRISVAIIAWDIRCRSVWARAAGALAGMRT